MRAALAFIAIIIAFGIFMPDVLRALDAFLLVFFGKATAVIQAMPVTPR